MTKNLLISVVGIMLISSCLSLRDFKQIPSFLKKIMESRQSKNFLDGLLGSKHSLAFLEKLMLAQRNGRFGDNTLRFQPNKQGHATNCGPPDHNFTLTWEPAPVDPSGSLTFLLDMKSPMDYAGGELVIGVSPEPGQPPVYEYKRNLNCDTVKQFFPKQHCPVKKGEHIFQKYVIQDMSQFSVPPGTYALKLTVKGPKYLYICAELVVTIE